MGLLEGVEMDRLPPPERPAPAVPLPEPAALLARTGAVVAAVAGAAGAGLEFVTALAVTVIALAEAAGAVSWLGVEAGAEGAAEAADAGVVTGGITSGLTAAEAAGFAVVAAGLAAAERLEAALLGVDRDLEVAMAEGDGARYWMRGGRRRSRGERFSRRATSGR